LKEEGARETRKIQPKARQAGKREKAGIENRLTVGSLWEGRGTCEGEGGIGVINKTTVKMRR